MEKLIFYLLGFGVLLLLLISTIRILISKKISWKKSRFDGLIILFLTAVAISTLFSSPNKIQALLNPNFGLVMMVFLAILYFYVSRIQSRVGHARPLQFIIVLLLAFFFTIYSMIRVDLLMPPFRLSWYAALEVLKNPSSAIIGIGPDNFSVIFTRVKDFAYNQSPLWQINSFNVSHSAILQILTETGIFGLLAFGLLVFAVFKQFVGVGRDRPVSLITFIYLIIYLFIFPPSLIVWFLFFVTLGLVSQQSNNETMKQSTDLSNSIPIYIGIIIISLGLIGVSGYFLGRAYAAEYYFQKSIDGVARNNLREVYENQRQAIILNPYIERFHNSFAQTNLVIANNVSSKIKNNKLSEQDRQTITQAIQAGIAESKVAVSLNPQKAENWQSFAAIYLNVVNTAKGADSWTISAYQRAIIEDPRNPTYRVGLGGVYYSLKKYGEALKFFEQAVSLKPDWANANYNYAWANFQMKNYPQAVNAMQNTLRLIDKKTSKADYEKVQKELKEFKKMLPKDVNSEAK